MEIPIGLQTNDLVLEGRIERQSSDKAVIVTHPHPQYGGDMDNSVVMYAVKAYLHKGWSTLRFNFRGTGRSTGQFDEGEGEQHDLQAAIDFLAHDGYGHIDLVGYSFGAVVIAGWSARHPEHTHRLVFISPPVAFMAFPSEKAPHGLHRIITGSADELAPAETISALLDQWRLPHRLVVLQGADHSYFSHGSELEQALFENI